MRMCLLSLLSSPLKDSSTCTLRSTLTVKGYMYTLPRKHQLSAMDDNRLNRLLIRARTGTGSMGKNEGKDVYNLRSVCI